MTPDDQPRQEAIEGAAPSVAQDATPDRVSWTDLVRRIEAGDPHGMDQLYRLFSKGIRFYLCRQLGPQELDDRLHDTFVIVLQAIRRGELREPERLMGFVRTVVRRQVAAHIDQAMQSRRDLQDLDAGGSVADRNADPEGTAIARQRAEIMESILRSISHRDRDILTRFYLLEQTQEQICSEMDLTETQFRLLKSRAKARFSELGRRTLIRTALPKLCMRKTALGGH